MKIVLIATAAYAVYALVVSTAAYIRLPKAGDEAPRPQAEVSPQNSDRITLVEARGDAWNARVALLHQARSTVDIAYHTIHGDFTGDAFWGEVIRAADRGVTVRVILDGKVGASGRTREMARLANTHPNIEYRRFNPVDPLRPWKWHTLLHDKFILVDGEYLLLGGRNIGDRYYGPVGYSGGIVEDRDVMVWGDGTANSVLPAVQRYMDALWTHTDTKTLSPQAADRAGLDALIQRADAYRAAQAPWYAKSLRDYTDGMIQTQGIRLLHNPLETKRKEATVGLALRDVLLSARETAVLQTPYATANRACLDALAQASGSADVRLQTNSAASSPNFIAFSNYYVNRQKFMATGAGLYEYQGEGSIHGKSLIVDGRMSAVGSLNLDDRSLFIDTETMLLVDSEAFAAQLGGAIDALTAQSIRIGEAAATVPALPVRWTKRAMLRLAALISVPFQFLI